VTDRIAIRGALQRNARGSYIRDTLSGARYGKRETWAGRMKLSAQVTENLNILLSAEYFDADLKQPARQLAYVTPGSAFVTLAGGQAALDAYIVEESRDKDTVRLDFGGRAKARSNTYNAIARLDTSFGSIKLLGSHRNAKSASVLDLDGSRFSSNSTFNHQDLDQNSAELQVVGSAFDGAVDFATGLYYFEESGVDQSFNPLPGGLVSQFDPTIDNDSKAAYGQATWRFTKTLSFTGGLRYSVDNKGIVTRNRTENTAGAIVSCGIAGTSPASLCSLSNTDKFKGWSYTAGLEYKPVEDALLYVKTSKGFRSGGQQLRASTPVLAAVPSATREFEPEIVYSHEAGFKSEFLDRRLRFNLAAFYSRTKNAQRSTIVATNLPPPSPALVTILSNAATVRIYGFEAEVTAILFQGFQLSGTVSQTHPKYVRYTNALGQDRTSERFDSVPEWSYTISASYTRDLSLGRFAARADYSWLDEQATNSCFPTSLATNCSANPIFAQQIVDQTTLPSGAVLNGRISLTTADDRLELAVFGRNVTNNRDPVSAQLLSGLVTKLYREPRTFGVTATYRFNE